MHNLKLLALALLLTSLAITPSLAKPDQHGKGCEMDEQRATKLEHLTERLELTAPQEAEIKEIIAASKEKNMALLEEKRATREALREIARVSPLDEAHLRELVRKQSDQRADMLIAKHATRDRINKILTPEQQKKQEAFRQQRQEQRGPGNCRQEL